MLTPSRLIPWLFAGLTQTFLVTAAAADGGVLMTSKICQDPRDSIDTLWVSEKFGANDVYFMQTDGTVEPMSAASDFASHDNIYVVSHGDATAVGGIPKANFAKFLHAAHPERPSKVYFDSCHTASGTDTVLKLTNAQYGDVVPELLGPKGACQLVGDCNPSVADAKSRYDAGKSPNNRFETVRQNIMTVWTTKNYADSGKTWKAACQSFVDTGDYAGLNAWRLAVRETFLNAPTSPIDQSHNYGLLIQWNTGGKEFFRCGTEVGVNCP